MTVDERLRAAADALRFEVASHLEVGVPVVEVRRSGRRFVLALIAAAVVVALSAVVILVATDQSPTRPATVTADAQIRPGDTHVRLGWTPKGYVLQYAMGPGSSQGSGSGWDHQQDFIRYDAARDRATAVLTIRSGFSGTDQSLRTAAASLTRGTGNPVETIQVRGRDATRIGPTIAWEEAPGVIAAVNGPLAPDELVAFVDALQARPDGKGFDPGPLPAGYEALPEHAGSVVTKADSIVAYSAHDQVRGSLGSPDGALEVFVSTDTSLPLTTALADTNARLVAINGAEGVLADYRGRGKQVAWDPHPGLRIQVGGNLPVAQLLRAARSATSMSDREWRRFGDPHGLLFPDSKSGKVLGPPSTNTSTP